MDEKKKIKPPRKGISKTGSKFVRKKVTNRKKMKRLDGNTELKRPVKPIFDRSPKVEIDKAKLEKYNRGEPINNRMVKGKVTRKKFNDKEKKVDFALEQAVRSELLLTEDAGYLEAEEGEETCEISQSEIQDAVDPNSATKRFDLHLNDFGPYRMNYTRNGRFLLLGGGKGHVAAMDWISKKLKCEINVMESVHDVAWLHQETLYSVAQKKWVYFYDNQGTEIHCVKQLNDVVRLVFLPYHFLLSTVSSSGFITWLDVTVGKIIEKFSILKHYNPATVAQHPSNAMVCIGEPSGVVNFWSPNYNKASITKWCHKQSLSALAFDPKGQIFATASIDRTVKLWDARNLNGPVQHYSVRRAPQWISLSQRGLMALGMGNIVEIYKDCTLGGEMKKKLYLRHSVRGPIKNMEFCPYEDILGIGHAVGFSSILVPGSAEANFDALEANPFQTKAQRREAEIQKILNKIPSDLITWDPTELRKIHIPSLEEIIEQKKKIDYIKPPNIHIEPRYKSGKRSGSAYAIKRKKIMKEELRREHVKKLKESEEGVTAEPEEEKPTESSVLDRFKPKTRK
ncbi:UNVERIFIED_CONTAM: hypothetical protein PYX00_003665 [Menopon gallinae]|uniref:BING4 C-terminal domain-containing protein n=1 Tax=Menopon gallinae TaxID=328185 RepID=A0AAW2I2L6_9NEOP